MSIHLLHKLNFEWVCVGSFFFFDFLQGFIHSKWLFGISSINSTTDWNEQSIINTWLMHEVSVEFWLLNYQWFHQVRSNIACPTIYIQYLDLLEHHCTLTFFLVEYEQKPQKPKQTSSLYSIFKNWSAHGHATPYPYSLKSSSQGTEQSSNAPGWDGQTTTG